MQDGSGLTTDSSSADISRKTAIYYSASVGPIAIMGLPLSIYLPPYISEGGVVAVALVGLMFSISTLWDGVVDPLIGTMIDRKSKGDAPHRRWMAMAALPLLFLLALLVTVGDRLDFRALLPLLLLYYSCYSLFDVAHLAWGSALSDGRSEVSARLFGAREYIAKLVLVIAFAAPALAQYLLPDISLQGRIIAYVSLVVIAMPIALIANQKVPSRPVLVEPGFGWRKELKLSLQSPSLLLILAVHFLNAFAFGAMASTYIFFAEAYLRLDQYGSLLLFLTFVGGAITTPLWVYAARKLGKPKGMILMCATLVALLIGGMQLPLAGQLRPSAVFTIVIGGAFMGLIFIFGMIADYAPVDAQICGRDRTAFIFATGNLMQKLGNASALALSYWLLGYFGFDPARPHEHGEVVRNIWAGLPIAAWGIAALVALFLVRQPWAQVRQLPLPHTPAKV
ncbi:MAG TPA: MFS transporter [Sphingorhabdus sp.]|uniref:MFS transporter n=1 Tax=Sphingorhabdus sp. TaxID=1902408 RepID=UPI002C3616F5|nr:MFS transporter [Sphingorhabdus sp.]HMT42144.1 MFS transporter [Sphingorhabdus sp.]HMU21148.1 MFS transporter [Sphingorhabdus sp.]